MVVVSIGPGGVLAISVCGQGIDPIQQAAGRNAPCPLSVHPSVASHGLRVSALKVCAPILPVWQQSAMSAQQPEAK
jgi:hypothetical protein